MRTFAIIATYYIPVSFKEQKQPCVGVKPAARGRADFLPVSLYVSLPPFLSLPFINHPWLVGQRAWC